MTPQEFRTVGLALAKGVDGWQAALATHLGVPPRTIHRWASGASCIPPGVASALRPALPDAELPRDEWIVGDGAAAGEGFRREYVVHTRSPRFVARAVVTDPDGRPDGDEEPADTVTGMTYQAREDLVLCEFKWLDYPPADTEELRKLLEAAVEALDASAEG